MPPKAAATGDKVTLTANQAKVLRAVLCNVNYDAALWKDAGEQLGMAQARDSSNRYKTAIRPLGLKLENNKVSLANEAAANDDEDAAEEENGAEQGEEDGGDEEAAEEGA